MFLRKWNSRKTNEDAEALPGFPVPDRTELQNPVKCKNIISKIKFKSHSQKIPIVTVAEQLHYSGW